MAAVELDQDTAGPSTAYQDELRALVALDTASPLRPERSRELAHWLKRYGLERVSRDLFARGTATSRLWLYTHADTKPAGDRSAWLSDPYSLVEREGRWCGLGVSDAKSQLLNVLLVSDPARHFLLVDASEEYDSGEARAFLAGNQVETLVVVDGAVGDCALYDGVMGQADGVLTLRTGEAQRHPARVPIPLLHRQLAALLASVDKAPFHFRITGMRTPWTERSLSAEEAEIRFDVRFDLAAQAALEHFLARSNATLRQWLLPLQGQRRPARHLGVCSEAARFACRLGTAGNQISVVIAAPGGDLDDGNHQPNESISIRRVAEHQQRLAALLRSLEDQHG